MTARGDARWRIMIIRMVDFVCYVWYIALYSVLSIMHMRLQKNTAKIIPGPGSATLGIFNEDDLMRIA